MDIKCQDAGFSQPLTYKYKHLRVYKRTKMKTAISFIMKFQFQHQSKLEKSFLFPSFFLEQMKTLSERERESMVARWQ